MPAQVSRFHLPIFMSTNLLKYTYKVNWSLALRLFLHPEVANYIIKIIQQTNASNNLAMSNDFPGNLLHDGLYTLLLYYFYGFLLPECKLRNYCNQVHRATGCFHIFSMDHIPLSTKKWVSCFDLSVRRL